jgi:hypothetical protein
MGQRLDKLTPELQRFIEAQPLFFVATAPLSSEGHVNLSPKGLDSLRVFGPRQVAYVDLTGSGNETSAHITQNGRLTIMLCAFTGKPRILRLYCRGRVVTRSSAEWAELSPRFPEHVGMRQIIVGDIEMVLTSCGYAVPEMSLVAERDLLRQWSETRGDEGLADYRRTHNRESIDGIACPPTDN